MTTERTDAELVKELCDGRIDAKILYRLNERFVTYQAIARAANKMVTSSVGIMPTDDWPDTPAANDAACDLWNNLIQALAHITWPLTDTPKGE